MTSTLRSFVLAAFVVLVLPSAVRAQEPVARRSFAVHLADPTLRTRRNPIHFVGIALGAVGVAGGLVITLVGTVANAARRIGSALVDGRASDDGNPALAIGLVIGAAGALGILLGACALGTDRIAAPARPWLSASDTGFVLGVDVAL